ncbi:MAG: hypothetical protein ACI9HU_000253 [Colwellia sp.]|jgi:hypothetical protein
MSKFKVGDRIRITVNPSENCNSLLRVGDVGIIDKFYLNAAGEEVSASMACDLRVIGCFHKLGSIELAKPKWTIYNNTLPWSDLSDKQKGKLLLSAHNNNNSIKLDEVIIYSPSFDDDGLGVYQAVEPVKPEPTMAKLFAVDYHECPEACDLPEFMIAKGWVKK